MGFSAWLHGDQARPQAVAPDCQQDSMTHTAERCWTKTFRRRKATSQELRHARAAASYLAVLTFCKDVHACLGPGSLRCKLDLVCTTGWGRLHDANDNMIDTARQR